MCLRETSSLNRMTFYSFTQNLINKWSWSLQPFRRRRCNLLCFCDIFWNSLCSYLKHSANYKNSTEAGEMAHWLRELTALAEERVWFAGPMSGSSCPLAFSGACSHVAHIHSLVDMHTHKYRWINIYKTAHTPLKNCENTEVKGSLFFFLSPFHFSGISLVELAVSTLTSPVSKIISHGNTKQVLRLLPLS